MDLQEGVPIPKVNRYRFEDWPIGGSRFFPSLAEVECCASAAYSYAKWHQNGFRMTRRKEGDGYRIWRIE
jgi:hypothetical protein